jgi:hypothetical protein
MKSILNLVAITIAAIALSTQASAQTVNDTVKKKLKQEMLNVRTDFSKASTQISELKKDKATIEKNLNDMRDWGIDQQKLALEYFNAKTTAETDKEAAVKNLGSVEKKYKHIKGFVGYLAGALLLFLYLRFGAGLLSKLAFGAGVWAPLIEVLSPLAVFCAGYFAAYLYF